MGLLTQLIAQHHDTEVRDKAAQVGMWKGILEDQRAPEDGGFTNDMKNHALEQMVGMAHGGKSGGGAKGKAGEMLGVFQHLLGIGKGNSNRGAGGALQGAMGAGNVESTSTPTPSAPMSTPVYDDSTPDNVQPAVGGVDSGLTNLPLRRPVVTPGVVINPLQRIDQRTPQGVQGTQTPPLFLSPEARAQLTDARFDAETGRLLRRDEVAGAQDMTQAVTQAGLLSEAKVTRAKKLIANGVEPRTAYAIEGIQVPLPAHKIGATDKFLKDGKPFIRTYMSDGTSTDEPDVTPQSPGGTGPTGMVRNLKWAQENINSTDPATKAAAQGVIDGEKARVDKIKADIARTKELTTGAGSGSGTSPNAITLRAANDPKFDVSAWGYLTNGMLSREVVGRGKEGVAEGQAIKARANQLMQDLGLNTGDVLALRAKYKGDFSTLGKITATGAAVEQFEKTLLKNVEIARNLSDAYKRGDVQFINRIRNAFTTGTGDTEALNLSAQLHGVSREWAKIMSGATGTAGVGVTDAKDMDELISKSMSNGQLNSLFDNVVIPDARARKAAIEETKRGLVDGIRGMTGAKPTPTNTPANTPGDPGRGAMVAPKTADAYLKSIGH